MSPKVSSESVVSEIKRKTRRKYSSEEKIRALQLWESPAYRFQSVHTLLYTAPDYIDNSRQFAYRSA